MKFTQMMSKEVKNPLELKPQQEKKNYYDFAEVESRRLTAWCKQKLQELDIKEQNKINE